MFAFLNRLRLQWDTRFLLLNGVCCEEKRSYTTTLVAPLFSLDINLLAGWYMLEVQIKSPFVRINSRIFHDGDDNDDNIKPLSFPIHSDRICKRLINLSTSGKLSFDLQLSPCCFELKHFRLVRVTQNFARSRLLRKLTAMHPRYKLRQGKHRYNLPESADTSLAPTMQALWEDYCALFEEGTDIISYPHWISQFDNLTDETRDLIRMKINTFEVKPLVSVIMPVYNPNPLWLQQAIESVRSQIYQNWELCIADDASSDPIIHPILERFVREDSRIKVLLREQNGHISAASNSALSLVQGEWIALFDHDDLLSEHALFWVIDAINKHPESRLIYSDEDKIDESGVRSDPYFKCDWNQDLFYSQNMFSHLGVYFTELVHEVGGFRLGFEGSQDYDLVLRCIEKIDTKQIHHIPRVLYHWRIHAGSTAHSSDVKPYAMVAGERAITEHLARIGVEAAAESTGYGYRVRYALTENPPLVSLIIPTRNGVKHIRKCVESIREKTTYPNYELLIVDNGSDDSATLRYLKSIVCNPRIRVIRDDRPFNYSALNNAAVKSAHGEFIGLINDDIEVISSEWLSEMVSHALRPEVGVVGARLWYSDNTLQHAGVVVGLYGVAGHAHRFLPRGNFGYCGRAVLIQSFSAVTGACMLVRKSIYEALGGLNEKELQVTCNDVDFCLRVREAGYRNIWTPYAELIHHESATRGFAETAEKLSRTAQEVAYMRHCWGGILRNDPAYNPNLSLDSEDFSLAWPPRVEPVFTNFVQPIP